MTKIEQPATTVIDGRLIQQGGGFTFNDKLFDEYQGNMSCTKFRDKDGKIFDSITIYHVVNVNKTVSSFVSTDEGLFLYNADAGEATALSYELNDMVFMQAFYSRDHQITDILVGFYPLDEGNDDTNYGARKVTFNADGTLTYTVMEGVTIPSDVTWMKYKDRTDYSLALGAAGCPICYKGNHIWFSECTLSDRVDVTNIHELALSDVNNITDVININTLLIERDEAKQYFVISYGSLYKVLEQSSVVCSSIGVTYPHKQLDDISWYDQHYIYNNDINSTFALIIDNNASGLLSLAYIVFYHNTTLPTDRVMHHVETNESNGGINGGYVNGDIKHRIYTTIDNSGYTDGTTVYATRRHIFASSTRLMDINDIPFAALMYFRAEDTNNYSILPSTNKTPIFTINASIDIDNQKYGDVIATDYNSVKGLYYIYTNSHVGIYFTTTRQLTWAASDIMTQIQDIYSFNDITVIDGQAKEFVNGIMTTTAMNGPTFDQLYAEIDELRKRIAALESMIRTEKITYSNRTVDECIVWNRKIGSGSGDVSNSFFLKEGGYSIVPDIRYGTFKDTDGTEREAGVMEIGNFIDFHVPNTENNEGIHKQKDHDGCSSVAEDFCARIYVDKNNSLIIKANGLYYQPLNGTISHEINTTSMDTGSE